MPQPNARDRFLELLRAAVRDGTLVKLTLGKHRGGDATLRNLFVRPVALKTGPQLAFLWRHATRDITKNHPPAEALAALEPLIGGDFLDAHLFTPAQQAQLQGEPDGNARLKLIRVAAPTHPAPPAAHDRAKAHLIPADARWLRALGVTNERGQPREGMADKFRQIEKFAELLSHLLAEAEFPAGHVLQIADMGAGKGYLTFAVAALLGDRAHVLGVEQRPELVDLCNRIARENGLAHLEFTPGRIDSAQIVPSPQGDNPPNRESKIVPTEATGPIDRLDVLIALHACDTATDDALARGIAAHARVLVVSPCCQKELRPQLTAPPVLAAALRHGIFQERQAEFVTDALRAQLLEWAGYRTKVFEFISTEHTAKNLMIAAIKTRERDPADGERAQSIRAFAAFYGIRAQKLAQLLSFPLHASSSNPTPA